MHHAVYLELEREVMYVVLVGKGDLRRANGGARAV
jgi:hypothetical protein